MFEWIRSNSTVNTLKKCLYDCDVSELIENKLAFLKTLLIYKKVSFFEYAVSYFQDILGISIITPDPVTQNTLLHELALSLHIIRNLSPAFVKKLMKLFNHASVSLINIDGYTAAQLTSVHYDREYTTNAAVEMFIIMVCANKDLYHPASRILYDNTIRLYFESVVPNFSYSVPISALPTRTEQRRCLNHGSVLPVVATTVATTATTVVVTNKAKANEPIKQREVKPRPVVDEELIDKLPRDMICPVCMQFLWIPVTTEYGHTYCRECIEMCIKKRSVDPKTNKQLATRVLIDNHLVHILINEFLKLENIVE